MLETRTVCEQRPRSGGGLGALQGGVAEHQGSPAPGESGADEMSRAQRRAAAAAFTVGELALLEVRARSVYAPPSYLLRLMHKQLDHLRGRHVRRCGDPHSCISCSFM